LSQGATAIAQDATINAYNGAPSGAVTDTTGVIGNAKVFDGQTAYFAMAGTASGKLNFPLNGPSTISAWVNVSVLDGNYHCIISKGDNQYALQVIVYSNQFEYFNFDNAQGWQEETSPGITQTWKYLVGVRNGTNQFFYVDGVLADQTIAITQGNGRVESNNVTIGKLSGSATRFFKGKIDEVNMANVARSGDWIKLSFQNQKPGSTVVTVK
jgi:biopolymer transport protein ExbB